MADVCYLWKGALFGLSRDPRRQRAHSDSAARVLERRVQDRPGDWTFHSRLGIAYTGQRHFPNALREAETGVELLPWSKDALFAALAL